MKTIAFTLALALAADSAFAETARDIFTKFESQKAEALAAYLAANPKAGDAADAEELLIDAYTNAGKVDQAAALFQKRYDALSKGADADLQALMAGVVEPLFTLYAENGKKPEATALLDRAEADLAAHPQASQIKQFLGQFRAELAKPAVGDTLEIAFTAVDGAEVDLAKMKGKVVLVDFWATWCAPCVADLPNVLAAYKEFHEKGFEVIAISLDDNKATLGDFVKKHELPWPQHFDGKAWDGDMVKRYGVSRLPSTYLVGKDGKVAAVDLHGDEFSTKVKELLGL